MPAIVPGELLSLVTDYPLWYYTIQKKLVQYMPFYRWIARNLRGFYGKWDEVETAIYPHTPFMLTVLILQTRHLKNCKLWESEQDCPGICATCDFVVTVMGLVRGSGESFERLADPSFVHNHTPWITTNSI